MHVMWSICRRCTAWASRAAVLSKRLLFIECVCRTEAAISLQTTLVLLLAAAACAASCTRLTCCISTARVPQPAAQARLAAHRTAWERAALGRLRKVAEIQGELVWGWWAEYASHSKVSWFGGGGAAGCECLPFQGKLVWWRWGEGAMNAIQRFPTVCFGVLNSPDDVDMTPMSTRHTFLTTFGIPCTAVLLAEARLTGTPNEALIKSLIRTYKLLGAAAKGQLPSGKGGLCRASCAVLMHMS